MEANPYLLIPGCDGKMFRMSEAIGDMCAYSKLTDSILDIVSNYREKRVLKNFFVLFKPSTKQHFHIIRKSKIPTSFLPFIAICRNIDILIDLKNLN